MSLALQHRGPDGHGYLIYTPGAALERVGRLPAEREAAGARVLLAHRRLAILDLDHGSDQPMVDEEAGLAVVYNGEIYNFLELREELEGLGFSFETKGDTEVLLRAYEAWGSNCVTRFVGMWAFAILDVSNRRLLLSRDRFGIKPLYYARCLHGWAFASEIKSLLLARGIPCEPNPSVVGKYLTTGVVDDTDQTFFDGITRVPAASNLVIEGGWAETPRLDCYWELPRELRSGGVSNEENLVAEFRERLTDSIRIHARSDVEVGGCLSGGLDSSTIVYIAEELRREGEVPAYDHEVFGYIPPEEDISEEPYMRDAAATAGAKLTLVAPDQEAVRSAIPMVVAAQDEPFGTSSILAQYFVFDRARRSGLKVMLDGQGADEILAGYHGYFPVVAGMQLRRGDLRSFATFSRLHQSEFGRRPMSWASAAAQLVLGLPGAARAARWARSRLVSGSHGRWPVNPIGPLSQVVRPELFAATSNEASLPSTLNDLLREQVSTTSLPALLRFEDRNSMAHSIEGRVPFLDHRLVEYCFSLPDTLKLSGIKTKYVLRKSMASSLPQSVLERKDKIGFRASRSVTWDYAASGRHSLDENQTHWEKLWLRENPVSSLLDSPDRSDAAENALWRIVNLKLWLRQFWASEAADSGSGR